MLTDVGLKEVLEIASKGGGYALAVICLFALAIYHVRHNDKRDKQASERDTASQGLMAGMATKFAECVEKIHSESITEQRRTNETLVQMVRSQDKLADRLELLTERIRG